MSRLRHLGESMFSWSYLKTVGIVSSSMLGAVCAVGYPKGSAAELEAPVLYHCFYQAISLLVLPRLGGGFGKRRVATSGNLLDCRGNFG